MQTAQVEIRLLIVIELPKQPVIRVMAIAAIQTEIAFMSVVIGMAGDASSLLAPEDLGLMTIAASDRDMLADQRE